jgi:hypothetical protein
MLAGMRFPRPILIAGARTLPNDIGFSRFLEGHRLLFDNVRGISLEINDFVFQFAYLGDFV